MNEDIMKSGFDTLASIFLGFLGVTALVIIVMAHLDVAVNEPNANACDWIYEQE